MKKKLSLCLIGLFIIFVACSCSLNDNGPSEVVSTSSSEPTAVTTTTVAPTTIVPTTVSTTMHMHSYSSSWAMDEANHWYECACGEKKDLESHTYGDWVIIKDATKTETGSKKQVCSICGYENIIEFSLITYTISYNLNGGENNDLNPISFTYLDDNITLYPLSDLFGMSFEGWYTSSDFDENTKITTIDTSIEKNVDLYAKWKEFKIVEAKGFETDNESDIPSLYMEVSYDTTSLNLSDLIKVSDGANWIITNSSNNLTEELNKTLNLNIGNNEYYIIVTNEDYYTIYSINVYRLNKFSYQFIVDGESILGVCEIEENGMIDVDLSNYTNKTGFDFNGWLISGTDNNFAEFPFKATANVTFIAAYTPISYKIEYVLNDEYENDSRNVESFTITDSNIVLYNPKSIIGRSFLGWYTSPTFESDTKITFIDTKNPKNYVLYPNFISYCIESAEDFTFDYENYALPALTIVVPNSKTLLTLSRSITVSEGCSWTLSKDIEGIEVIKTKNVSLNTGNNIYYITVWYNDDYNIVYILDIYRLSMFNYQFIVDGNVVIEETTVEENTLIDPDYSKYIDKVGYSFKGFTANESEEIVTFPYKVVENVIFEAVFTPNKYNINYYINDTLKLTDEAVYDAEYTFKSGIESSPGYEAIKWVLEGIEYNANQTITYNFDKSIDLVAIIAFVDSTNFEYSLNDTVVTITKYNGNESNVLIPEYIKSNNKYYKVTKIDSNAFSGCSSLESITIPSSVTSIGSYAFDGCSSLTSIEIPSSVTSIGSYAFYGCYRLVEVYNLSSLDITIGSTDNGYIGYYAKVIHISLEEESNIIRKDDYIFIYDNTNYYLVGYEGTEREIVLPEDINDNSYLINTYAFYNCSSLTSIEIPAGVTSIGSSAFSGCSSLTNIEIPISVTSIGEYAFSGCISLTNIVIPISVTSIGSSAFSGCSSLESLTIPFVGAKAGVTSSDTYQYPFGYIFGESSYEGGVATTQYYYGSSTSSITYDTYYIPSTLKSVTVLGENILSGSFSGCSNLRSIKIPAGVTSIGSSAFSGCSSLTSIEIPSSVTSIDSSAFRGCSSLESIVIPSSVTSIGWSAFEGCSSLTSIEIPSSVTSIGWSAFEGCSSLESIVIPNSVTSIGEGAFEDCSSLVYNEYDNGYYLGNDTNPYLVLVEVKFTDITSCEINENTRIICSAFEDCIRLTSIEIPSSVTSIGSYAFSGCSNLRSIKIPAGVTSIGRSAFEGCSSLTSIEIPSSVTSIDSSTFYNCRSLESIVIPNSVTSIGSDAFYNCRSLTSIEIPSSVTSIGSSAFRGCSSVTSIEIPSSVTSIDSSAFYNCSSLESIVIPNSVTSIGNSAFFGCSSLTSIEIPNSVTSIGDIAFSGCSSLESIEIPSSVTSIGWSAFSGCSSLSNVYYNGTSSDWSNISIISGNSSLTGATRYYYSEAKPTSVGKYWHYVDGVITIW